jgi:manganese oxidase
MTTRIQVVFYSMYGHVYRLAEAVSEGAREVVGTEVPLGPFGLLLYVLADKEPRPGEHEKFTSPLWKQGVGSAVHCVAGDATGIILAAAITALLGLPMGIDLIVEYVAGFSFGLFIFQSLFMKKMMGGTYWENVRKSFLPEFISMNAMMAGMAPTMSFLMMGRDMRAMDPTELVFWVSCRSAS